MRFREAVVGGYQKLPVSSWFLACAMASVDSDTQELESMYIFWHGL